MKSRSALLVATVAVFGSSGCSKDANKKKSETGSMTCQIAEKEDRTIIAVRVDAPPPYEPSEVEACVTASFPTMTLAMPYYVVNNGKTHKCTGSCISCTLETAMCEWSP